MATTDPGTGMRTAAVPVVRPWRRRLRLLLALTLVLAAGAYIATSMGDQWHALRESAFVLPAWHWVLLCVGVVGTLVLSTLYHMLLLRGVQDHPVPGTRVAHAYALGQMVRYVPGKVAGVVFQIGMLGNRVRPGSVLLALLVQTLHDYAWTFAFCSVLIWALLIHNILPLLAFAPLAAALHAVHLHRPGERMLAKLPLVGAHVPALPPSSPQRAAALTATLLATWLPMVAGMVLAFAPLLGWRDALFAACLYLVAAVVSLAMVVVPSGLVVREAVFLWLGHMAGLPVEALLFVALATRLTMTVAELVVALAASAADALAVRGRRVIS